MRLHAIVIAFMVGVIFVLTGIVLYWAVEPRIDFIAPTVKIITQEEGVPVAIDVITDNYAIADSFALSIKIVDQKGILVRQINASQIVVGKKYKVLTGSELPVGIFEVSVTVDYQLNPLRKIEQHFPIAILHVIRG